MLRLLLAGVKLKEIYNGPGGDLKPSASRLLCNRLVARRPVSVLTQDPLFRFAPCSLYYLAASNNDSSANHALNPNDQTRPGESLPQPAQVENVDSAGADPNLIIRSHADGSYDSAKNVDITLARYLANPVVHSIVAWPTIASSAVNNMTPGSIYFDSVNYPALYYRLRYYRHMRATMVVTINTNSTPHHYGRLIFQLAPYRYATAISPNIYGMHAGDNVAYLDASTANTVTLKLPFSAPFDWFNTRSASAEQKFLGVLHWGIVQEIKRDDGGTAGGPVFTVSVSLEDFHCKGPTDATVATLSEEIKPKGPISGPLAKLSSVFQSVQRLPFVGKYADIGSVFAQAGSNIASTLGYGRPIEPVSSLQSTIINAPYGNLTNVNLPVSGQTLSLFSDTASTMSGEYIGSVPDTMSWDYLIRRWGFLTSLSFPQAGLSLDGLGYFPVSPSLAYKGAGNSFVLTPMATHAIHHTYWSGEIDFRVVIPATPYIKARVAIVYYPNVAAYGPGTVTQGELAALPHCILDVENEVDKVFTIGWSQSCVALVIDDVLHYVGTTDATGSNGILAFYIFDPIQASVATGVDLQITVFARAGKNFRFYHPRDNKFTDAIVSTGVTQNFRLKDVNVEPKSSCYLGDGSYIEEADVRLREPTLSPRSVLQRPQLWGVFTTNHDIASLGDGDDCTFFFVVPHVPSEKTGLYYFTDHSGSDTANYFLTRTTYLSELLACFIGYRGATRITIPPNSKTDDGQTFSAISREYPSYSAFTDGYTFSSTAVKGPEIMGYWDVYSNAAFDATNRASLCPHTRFTLTGSVVGNTSARNGTAITAQAPFDCPHRYSCQAGSRSRPTNPGYRIITTTGTNNSLAVKANVLNPMPVQVMYSIADDFQLFFFIGCPTFTLGATTYWAPTVNAFPTT